MTYSTYYTYCSCVGKSDEILRPRTRSQPPWQRNTLALAFILDPSLSLGAIAQRSWLDVSSPSKGAAPQAPSPRSCSAVGRRNLSRRRLSRRLCRWEPWRLLVLLTSEMLSPLSASLSASHRANSCKFMQILLAPSLNPYNSTINHPNFHEPYLFMSDYSDWKPI